MKQEDFEQGKTQLKYHSNNPIYKNLVNRFNAQISTCFEFVANSDSKITKILEIGVGEGQMTELALKVFPSANFFCADIANGILKIAKKKLSAFKDQLHFEIQDVTNLTYEDGFFDLLICCEVLEHVPKFQAGIKEITRVLKPNGYAIISVPNEPLWRICNLLRGYYWTDLGNTPGHVNNWSPKQAQHVLEQEGLRKIQLSKPIPWSIFLLKKQQLKLSINEMESYDYSATSAQVS